MKSIRAVCTVKFTANEPGTPILASGMVLQIREVLSLVQRLFQQLLLYFAFTYTPSQLPGCNGFFIKSYRTKLNIAFR